MGRILIIAVFLVSAFIVSPNVYANEVCEITDFDDPLICGSVGGDEELALINTIKNTLSTVYLWIGILTVIFMMVGGISYITSQGNPEKVKRAKETIIYALCGLIVTLSAFAITNFTIGALEGSSSGASETRSKDSPFGEDRKKVKGVFSITKLTLIEGQKKTIKARVAPDYAKNKTLTFKIDKSDVATIDQKGKVTAKKKGEATITIKSPDGPSTTVALTVVEPIPVTEIHLSKTEVKLTKGKSIRVTATPLPRNATDKTLIWASQDDKVATVDQSGNIRAIKSDAETYVTVTARNKPVFAFNQSPNKITLADAELSANFPKVEAKIKVIVESEFYACSNTTRNKKFSGNLEIRSMSKKLIDKAKKDFYYYNESNEISRRGGYTKYVSSLGGIFKMYAGESKKFKIKSACDYQAAAEYAFGLWSVWGVDYDNGSSYHYWGGSTSDQSDGFWQGAGGRYAKGDYAYEDIDTNLSSDKFKHRRRTNCNYAADALNLKTNLSPFKHGTTWKSGQRITNTRDLQVGDMVHYFRGPKWRHVAMVGEVYDDYVILYDGGGRFIETKQYKKKVRRGGYGEMMNGTVYDYDDWVAVRHWNIDQSKALGGLK